MLSGKAAESFIKKMEVLKQFIRAIKSFCGRIEEESMESAIKALVTESRDSYAMALLISRRWKNLMPTTRHGKFSRKEGKYSGL